MTKKRKGIPIKSIPVKSIPTGGRIAYERRIRGGRKELRRGTKKKLNILGYPR